MRFWRGSEHAAKVPNDDLWHRIESLDLGMIKFKLMDPTHGKGWSQEKADRMEVLYKRFLYLSGVYPDKTIVPTKELDEVWHAHILDTSKYAEDCQNLFGHVLRHFPYLGMRGPEDAKRLEESFAETNRIFREEFGEPLVEDKTSTLPGNAASTCDGIWEE